MPESRAGVLWVSIDPVRRSVDVYPRAIAHRIESALINCKDKCELGADYFNATVHFQANGISFQTTPGQHMGRSGYKAPGFRSVCRIDQPEGCRTFTLFGRRVHGEWRMVGSEVEAEYTFVEEAKLEDMLPGDALSMEPGELRTWTGEDLAPCAADVPCKSVVVWQWCRGTPEVNGELMRLEDEMWCPYMFDANNAVEAAFHAGEPVARVELEERRVEILFKPGSPFALQTDVADSSKERQVRRAVKTVQELREMHVRMRSPDVQISGEECVSQAAPVATIPPEFFCPITQDIMTNPYCTVDGFTYERKAISLWFNSHNTSPLTGLALTSLDLRPNLGLKQEIQLWLADHAKP